jgi:RNA polymerase sigma-70 factor (ECF subfamily)
VTESENVVRLDAMDETTLVARAQDGDVLSFEVLVDRYQGPLFRLALRMLHDRGQAEDVVQESLTTVWRRIGMLSDPVAFPRWTYQITTRVTLNALRSRTRQPVDAADPVTLDDGRLDRDAADADRFDPAGVTENQALATALRTQIALLPDELRLCWTLYADHGRTYQEIAEIIGVSRDTVRGRIARARQRLAGGMTSWQ